MSLNWEARTYRPKRTEPLRGAMKRYLKASGIGWMMRHRDILDAWHQAVGPEVGAHSRVRGLRAGTLHVDVSSPALRTELEQFYADAVLEAIRATEPGRTVRRVRFHLAPADAAPAREAAKDGDR